MKTINQHYPSEFDNPFISAPVIAVGIDGIADAAQLALRLKQHAEQPYTSIEVSAEARRLEELVLKTIVADPTAGPFSFVPGSRALLSTKTFGTGMLTTTGDVLKAVVDPTAHLGELMINSFNTFSHAIPDEFDNKYQRKYNQEIKLYSENIIDTTNKHNIDKKYPPEQLYN